MSGWTGPAIWLWPVVLLAGLVLVVVGMVLLRRSPRVTPPGPGAGGAARQASSAQEILEERLARGEIDVAEYERRAAALDE